MKSAQAESSRSFPNETETSFKATEAEIQIEVETLEQLREALAAGATSVLLDNFDLAGMRQAGSMAGRTALLDVSGGVTLDQLCDIDATGVDRISVGKLTKDVLAVDFSMRLD